MKFVRISRQILEKSDVCRFFNQICGNKLENCQKILRSVKIIQSYSILFIRVLTGTTTDRGSPGGGATGTGAAKAVDPSGMDEGIAPSLNAVVEVH